MSACACVWKMFFCDGFLPSGIHQTTYVGTTTHALVRYYTIVIMNYVFCHKRTFSSLDFTTSFRLLSVLVKFPNRQIDNDCCSKQ